MGDESACKPDSVAPEGAGGHPSATVVANGLRASACDLPDDSGEQPSNAVTGPKALLGLAPGGVYLATPVTWGAGGLLHHRFTLTQPCGWAVCSLWHCPADHSGWVLPTALLCGVRTFLDPLRGRGHPADSSGTSVGGRMI